MTKVCHTKEMGISGTREYFDKEYAKMGKIGTNENESVRYGCNFVDLCYHFSIAWSCDEYAFMLIPWLSFLPGVNIATADTIRHMNIGTVFFMMACLTIATAGSAIGVPQLISAVLSPLAAQAGPIGICIYHVDCRYYCKSATDAGRNDYCIDTNYYYNLCRYGHVSMGTYYVFGLFHRYVFLTT